MGTEINFGRSFGGKSPCAFLCLGVAGQVQEVTSRTASIAWNDERAPGSVRRGALRMYRRSDQVLPLFVTDGTHDARLRLAVCGIIDLISANSFGCLPSVRLAHSVHSSPGRLDCSACVPPGMRPFGVGSLPRI